MFRLPRHEPARLRSECPTKLPCVLSRAMLMTLLALSVGCDVHQSTHQEPIDPPGEFSEAGSAPVPDRWWRAFEDPTLNRLQRRALKGNFDVRAARDRLAAARAVVDREAAADYPALDLSVNAQSRREEATDFEPTDQLGGSLVAEYEVDLWNRIESQVERAEFEADATRANLKTAAITLTANIATTWYELVQQRGQRRILKEQIDANKTVLRIIRLQFGKGKVRLSDVLRQQRLLQSTREQLERVRSEIEVLEHQLLELTGRSPTVELSVARNEKLPKLPPKPAPGLPSDLLHRRPDVRSAFYDVQAADRSIAVAIADRFPRLTLSVSTAISDEPSELFTNWINELAADAVTPVFDAGQRKAEVRRTEAVKRERLDQYGQTMLTAIREVSDALSREARQREQLRLIRSQLDLAQRTYDRLYREYLNGDIRYIDLLDAQTRAQQLQRDVLEARFQLIDNRIALYRALAGGWKGIADIEQAESREKNNAARGRGNNGESLPGTGGSADGAVSEEGSQERDPAEEGASGPDASQGAAPGQNASDREGPSPYETTPQDDGSRSAAEPQSR